VAGWVTVAEPYAKPPKRSTPSVEPTPDRHEGRHVVLEGVAVDTAAWDTTELIEAKVESSSIVGVSLGGAEVDAAWSSFERCDFSGADVVRLRECTIVDSRCTGLDLSEAELLDVVFERCLVNIANLRMAKLGRVSFVDCTLRDVDCYEAELTDVSFPGSTLEQVSLDRTRMSRVDLRDASELGLVAVASLAGCLVTEGQLIGLLHHLALAAGLDIERAPD
jgi:uncharacterized protein YjbI with pentapeptide repeats